MGKNFQQIFLKNSQIIENELSIASDLKIYYWWYLDDI